MEKIEDVTQLVYKHTQGGRLRWLTVSTLLLAIGAILHMFAPSVAGVTPNFMIATYCVAIILTKTNLKKSFGIGVVAAIVNMLTSKSAFPYGNLICEPIAAVCCSLIASYFPRFKVFGKELLPFFAGFFITIISGGIFVTCLKLVLNLPNAVYFKGMLPLVFIVACLNAIITPAIYFPAKMFFIKKGILMEKEREIETDHNQYLLEPKNKGIISIENLSYKYNGMENKALDNINLNINEGDFIVLIGDSGSGKSTLAMSLVGAVPHYFEGTMQGMVFVKGKAITQTNIADLAFDVGLMLADYETQLVMNTVEEEIAFNLENRGYALETIQQEVKNVMKEVGLLGLEKRSIQELSGGQKQRLVIASILVTKPSVLVLDEPTSALDPEGTREFYELISKLNKEYGHTIVVVENMLEEVISYANRLVVMHKGEIKKVGALAEALRFMYNNKMYLNLIPKLFLVQLEIEKAGYHFEEDFVTTEVTENELEKLLKGASI